MKNRKFIKRFLAFVLSAAMVITYMPLSLIAYAEDEAADAAASEPKAAAAEEVKSEPAPAPEPKAEPAPAAEEKSEPAPAAEENSEPAPAASEEAAPSDSEDSSSSDAATAESTDNADTDAAEAELTDPEAEVAEEEALEEEEEELEYPADTFKGSAGGVSVVVDAPEGALPEGTEMKVSAVSAASVQDAVESAIGAEAARIKAVDISFHYEGKEIEPKKAVKVHMNASGMTNEGNQSVVHISDNGSANVVTQNVSNGNATFNSGDFSIYIVVEEGEDARLTVKFVQADGTEVEMKVTKAQLDAGHLNTNVYDPGAGTLAEGEMFRGWSSEENYTSDTESLTIADVRGEVTNKLNAGVTDGESVTYYAMIFVSHKVTYLDEKSITIKTDNVMLPKKGSGSPDYTVSYPYTPYSGDDGLVAQFAGWQQIAPEVEGQKVIYQNGEKITSLDQDYTLRATVTFGHWLSFNENLRNASFTEPQFIPSGEKPTEPDKPTRAGYTFDGWYTADADPDARDGQVSGDKFDFSKELSENTTVHAKWTQNTTAPYSVVIWKQDVSGSGYDYAETVTVNNGTVGAVIDSVTARGTGDGRYARVNGTDKIYTGFHLDEFDENVTINAEGTTVLNVYYDRNEVTLKFVYRENGRWVEQETMTGLYGQTLASQGYTWPTNRWWYDDYTQTWGGYAGAGTRTTFLDAFILSDGSSEQTFYGFAGDGNKQVHFLQQNADGNGYTEVQVVESTGGTFYVSDKFNGFKAAAVSDNNTTWTTLGEKGQGGYYAAIDMSRRSNLYVRYDRLPYSIQYVDGVFVDGDGHPVDQEGRGQIHVTDNIRFGSDVSSYNKGGADYYEPSFDGFVFGGWYSDATCTKKYTFDTMPEGITVYAKWIQKEYHVVLHPNDDETDPIDYHGETQSEEFYVGTGEKVSIADGERIYYDLVGWYSNEAMTQLYNFDAIVLNDTTIAKYGNPDYREEGWPSVTGELNLYAKWRSKLIGANGINVVYDPAGGSNEPEDPNFYTDQADAVAGAASKSPDGDTETVFSHWIVQKWNGSAYEDTSVKVYPGDTFVVKAADAKVEDVPEEEQEEGGPTKTYTIHVKAVYIDKETETLTHINWYDNYGGTVREDKDLKINQAVDIPKAPTREHYIFKGWAREPEEGKTTSSTNLFLKYENGKYTHNGKEAKKVAADEVLIDGTKYHAMYAVWEEMDKLSYDANGGTGSMDPTYDDDGDSKVTVASNTFTREGYTFEGWNTQADGKGTAVAEGSEFELTAENDVVYAQWTPRTDLSYTVHYYEKDTTTSVAPDKTVDNQTFGTEVTESAIDVAGYTKVDPTNKTITIAVEGNEITFYYEKRTDLGYTVKYHEKDTETELSEDKHGTNKTLGEQIAETAIEIAGYVVDGASQATITITANESDNVHTFYYTKRTDLSYTVHYYEKDTTTKVADDKTVENQTFGAEVTESAIDVTGYTKVDPTSKTITTKVEGNEIIFYYEKRNDLSYTVHYYEEGTTTSVADDKTVENQTFGASVTEDAIDVEGYTKVDPTSATITIAVEGNVITFYYKVNKHNVTYEYKNAPAGADPVPAAAEHNYNSEVTVAANPAKVKDYVFMGWKTSDASVSDGKFTMPDKDVKFTGEWKDDKNNNDIPDDEEYRTIIYTDGVDGEEVFPDEVFDKALDGLPTPEFGDDPVREGYIFKGWSPEVAETVDGDATYVAQWEPEVTEVVITYDLNGGVYNGSTSDIKETYDKGTVISIHEAPTREGYEFLYWKGSEYQPGDKYTVTEDHTFVAQWAAIEVTDDDSDTPDKPDTSKGVKTGDESDVMGLLGLMSASIAGFVALFFRRRREQE